MHRVAELLGDGSLRVVIPQIGVVGLVAVGAPIALELAGVGVEYDDAAVAITVGNVQLIGLLVDE